MMLTVKRVTRAASERQGVRHEVQKSTSTTEAAALLMKVSKLVSLSSIAFVIVGFEFWLGGFFFSFGSSGALGRGKMAQEDNKRQRHLLAACFPNSRPHE